MNILHMTSEIHPLIKTGGLADVSRSLPVALQSLGENIRLFVPGYRNLLAALNDTHEVMDSFPYGVLPAKARLLAADLPGSSIPLWILDCPALFDRGGGPYQDDEGQDWPDNPLRFGAFCRAAAWLVQNQHPSILDWSIDLLHCHDWQTALTPALLKFWHCPVPTVLTIHNLAFQGNFSASWINTLGLPAQEFHLESLEFHGQLSFLKAGLVHADAITTVSPRYAREIQTPQMGCGLDGLLRHRSAALSGILNGIDELWCPDNDPLLTHHYSITKKAPKALNKAHLQQRLGLEVSPQAFLVGLVSRLTLQKGIDLVLDSLDDMLADKSVQLVVLGSGDLDMERRLAHWNSRKPDQVHIALGFNEVLSHQIIAGADLFLMPSRFEPCGLAQMYAMTYGTPPLVHHTGGLADTVTPYQPEISPRRQQGTGFVFETAHSYELKSCFKIAKSCFHNPVEWNKVVHNAMKKSFRWDRAAQEYQTLYNKLLKPT